MMVWGGWNTSSAYLNDGGRYNPTLNTWAGVPAGNAPAARYLHTAVWTGSEMIVWGGYNNFVGGYLSSGARFNPTANSWAVLPTTGAPLAREAQVAVWLGGEMIVWGGWSSSGL